MPSGYAAPVVSFVIPVRNDAGRLARCLRSIAALEYAAGRIEVVVVDNGSADDSARVATAAGARVLTCPDVHVGALRNRGAAHATGSVLAFVDADHEIATGWLKAAIETLHELGVGAVGSFYSAPSDGTWVQHMYDALRHRPTGRHEVTWLGSGNMALHRAAFEQAGGFRADLSTCEDVDLCRRLRAVGFRIISDDRLRSVHLGDPATLAVLFRSELWRGRENFRVTLRAPVSPRDLLSLAIPVIELIALATGAVGLITLAAGGAALMFGAAALIGSLAALRAARMMASRPASWSVADVGRAFAVAGTYDLGRALALVARASHHRRPLRPLAEPTS